MNRLKVLLKDTWELWYPMFVIFAAFTFVNVFVRHYYIVPYVINEIDIYRMAVQFRSANANSATSLEELDKMQAAEADRLRSLGIPESAKSKSIEAGLVKYVEIQRDRYIIETNQIARNLQSLGEDQVDLIVPFARSSLPNRFPGTETRRCGINIGCLIANGVKSILNSGYTSAKANMLSNLDVKIAELKIEASDHRSSAVNIASQQIGSVADDSITAIRQTARGVELVALLAQIYALVILFKSFLIVAARKLYSDETIMIDAESAGRTAPGKIADESSVMTLDAEHPTKTYFAFRSVGANAVDRRRIYQPFSLVLGRIVSGTYITCLIDRSDPNQNAGTAIKLDAPAHIVSWKIHEGQEVYFNIGDVIGYSAGCKFGRRVTLNMAALVFGRFIFHYARGPGTIYFKTDSDPITSKDTAAANVMHSSSLVAWSRNAEFNVISSLTKLDVFFSGYSIRKINKKSHLVIYDTSQKKRISSGRGIWRMARTFLTPF